MAVIFDWDGTIVNSMPVALENFLVLSAKYFGVDGSDARRVFLSNMGLPEVVLHQLAAFSGRDLSDDEFSKILREMYESFHKRSENSPVFEDAPKALSELRDEGYVLCVSSGGLEAAVAHEAKVKGLDHYFKLILGTRGDGFHKGEPHFNFISEKLSLEPREMVFVADGPYDMRLGKNYGCFTVGRVDLADAENLRSSGADVVLRDFHSLPRAIREYVNSLSMK